MKILSMFVTPRRGGHMAVVTTVQHGDGRVSSYALDPQIASDKQATIYARRAESFSEWASGPLELGWGSTGPIVDGPPPPPKGPGGDDFIAIPEPVIKASRSLWDSYQKLASELASGQRGIG
jgi:hypothetical protein